MPQGDQRKYTDKQKRMAEHIEEGYETRGVPKDEAEARAWATVNKTYGGGNKRGGGGYGHPEDHSPAKRGGEKGGKSQSAAKRSEAAKKGWETRRKNAAKK